MVDQFSIVICYCKILSAFLGVKGWRECEASEQVTLHVPVLRNYQVEASKTPIAGFKIRGH